MNYTQANRQKDKQTDCKHSELYRGEEEDATLLTLKLTEGGGYL